MVLVGEHISLFNPAPPPNNGLANSLEKAKHQFKQRYEEMKAHGVRPSSGYIAGRAATGWPDAPARKSATGGLWRLR
jgi:hypothetical protein